ncbi:MAG: DUF805 domain-containing protein [Acidobacteriaceae bacterium]|nr:DUF805 domain-containing protein [Acidobacteriaceae bacterium]
MKWYLKVLRHYADFSGRARRKEYWMFFLFNAIFSFAWTFVTMLIVTLRLQDRNLEPAELALTVYYLSSVYAIAVLLPGMAVSVRRLHDRGMSGWMILVGIIPFIGSFWLLILMLLEGQPGPNRYGPDPKLTEEVYAEPDRMRNAGRTAILASIGSLIVLFSMLPMHILTTFGSLTPLLEDFSDAFRYILPDLVQFFTHFTLPNFVLALLLMAAGVLLLRSSKTGLRLQVPVYLLLAYALVVIVILFQLVSSMRHIPIQFVHLSQGQGLWIAAWTIFVIPLIAWCISLLITPRNDALVKACAWAVAVATIIFVGIFAYSGAINLQHALSSSSRRATYEMLTVLVRLLNIPSFVAFMVLTYTFYPRKEIQP